ncbi:PspA/IM30 family protein [Bacillus sp. FJAT-27245]|uniref:PspA/IM30 family protein n=1 Tax=Bacillus sp. FJAT-27245 TaxID=1684144 RepID=UPI0006A77A52|nr:PspA/IM30 family protein [Bacillus sp. FJAT-27245]
MSLFIRIKNIITADLHGALDKCENPMAMLQQHLREMGVQVAKAQEALASQFYLEKKYEILLGESEATIEKRARQAELAVEMGKEDIAKLALQEKISEEAKLQMLRDQAALAKQNTAILIEQIEKLKAEYQDFQFKKLELESRVHAAGSIKQGHEMLKAFKFEGTAKGLAKAREYVYKLEAEAKASEHFKHFTITPAVSPTFQSEVEKQLEVMKQTKQA